MLKTNWSLWRLISHATNNCIGGSTLRRTMCASYGGGWGRNFVLGGDNGGRGEERAGSVLKAGGKGKSGSGGSKSKRYFGRGLGGRGRARGRGGGGGRDGDPGGDVNSDGSNPNKPPPGLKGREIGLWYARRQAQGTPEEKKVRQERKMNRNEERDRIGVYLSGQQKAIIRSALDSVRREQSATPRTAGVSTFVSARPIDDDNDDGSWFFPRKPLERNDQLDDELLREYHRMTESTGFQKMLSFRRKLPAFERRSDVMKVIHSGNVCVISGATGSGKTTQIPQFILDEALGLGDGSVTKIVCTQPRRISAISVAERVASERGESFPSGTRNKLTTAGSIGFQIRLTSVIPRTAGSILYCTTGVVLKWLESDPLLLSVSHLILDEVHERDLQTDFLITCLQDLMKTRKDLKLILMSATLDAEMFSKYFSNAPTVDIPGRLFPVQEWLLEEIVEKLDYEPEKAAEGRKSHEEKQRFKALLESHGGTIDARDKARDQIADEQRAKAQFWEEKFWAENPLGGELRRQRENLTRKTVEIMKEWKEGIDYELIHRLVAHIVKEDQAIVKDGTRGAILIFVPGWTEISKCKTALESSKILRQNSLHIIPLHSMMPTSFQREIFNPPPPGKTKVVISTNIAETSVTIDDVVYVIDSGLIKSTSYDPLSSVSILAPEYVSRANGRQRAGRAGRVQPGVCYHLYSSYAESQMSEYLKPELLRTPLEQISLQIKLLRRGSILGFLSKAMNPPSEEVVARAVKNLQQMQALDEDEDLTSLGLHLARMNADPHVGKMALYGAIFGCLDPILTIAASLGYRDPFVMPLGKEKESDAARYKLSAGTMSDHLMLFNAFTQWDSIGNPSAKNDFAWKHFLAPTVLNMLKDMKRDMAENLKRLGFITSGDPKDARFNVNSHSEELVKAIVCGGLYPQVSRLNQTTFKHRHVGKKGVVVTDGVSRSVALHAKSCLDKESHFPSPWIIYHQLLVTSSSYIFDATVVQHFPLLFFGGKIEKDRENDRDYVTVDDWIKFWCLHSVADDVIALRAELHQILASKIQNPRKIERTRGETAILDAIVALVTSKSSSEQKYFGGDVAGGENDFSASGFGSDDIGFDEEDYCE